MKRLSMLLKMEDLESLSWVRRMKNTEREKKYILLGLMYVS